jgi:glycosyltransferase involved in cell wall biosynthesis
MGEKMNGPLVSVVLPVYNSEAFLRETLESVFALEYEPLEVIVVDDGSTDGSAALAQSFPGVRRIRQENRGPAAARNAGIEAARGEFVAFVDADDIVLPHKLSVQVGYVLDHPDVTATLGRQEWITPPPNAVPDVVWGDLDGVPAMSIVIRTAAALEVGCFDPTLRGPEDTDLLMRLREGGYRFVVLPDIVMRRRYHGGNLAAGRPVTPVPLDRLKAKLDRERARSQETAPRPSKT